MSKTITCLKCGEVKEHHAKGMCRNCYRKKHYEENPEYCREQTKKWQYDHGTLPMSKNRDCPLFLGVHIAEQVLSKVFKNVEQMPNNNPGFDFKCNRGMKIDVKSSVLRYHGRSLGSWSFGIGKNTIADYFLCLAFNNREDLNPMHIWLIPGNDINHLTSTKISPTRISRWSKYEKDITKIISCCDTMRN